MLQPDAGPPDSVSELGKQVGGGDSDLHALSRPGAPMGLVGLVADPQPDERIGRKPSAEMGGQFRFHPISPPKKARFDQ